VIIYTYKPEDATGVPVTPSERHRRHTNLHIKAIGYGLSKMRGDRSAVPSKSLSDYPMVVVFDYGDHAAEPRLDDHLPWPARPDSFSNYRPGFELRTHRLCRRILMMHRFNTADHEVVRSTELTYAPSAAATTLTGVTHVGWKRSAGMYEKKSMPT